MLGSGGAASSSHSEDPDVAAAALELWSQCQFAAGDTGPEECQETGPSPKPSVCERPKLEGSSHQPHVGVVLLRQGTCKGGPCQMLEHTITGEVVPLPLDQSWALKMSPLTGIGFLHSRQQKQWVNSFFRCSVHKGQWPVVCCPQGANFRH